LVEIDGLSVKLWDEGYLNIKLKVQTISLEEENAGLRTLRASW